MGIDPERSLYGAAAVYPEVWADKANVARVYEQRLQAARAATDPQAAKILAELAAARRRRADLLLAPAARDPAARKKREDDIQELDGKVDYWKTTATDLKENLPNFMTVGAWVVSLFLGWFAVGQLSLLWNAWRLARGTHLDK